VLLGVKQQKVPVKWAFKTGRVMRARISLREALADPQLLGHALAGDSFKLWRTILIATMGEPLSEGERARFREFTDRDPPDEPVREAAFIVGRRGGKDRAASALVAYLATCCEWPMLAKGETGRVVVIAPDQSQSRYSVRLCPGRAGGLADAVQDHHPRHHGHDRA
jgi:hypothetical protein